MTEVGVINGIGIVYRATYDDPRYPGVPCWVCGKFHAVQPKDDLSEWNIYGGRMFHKNDLIEYEGHFYCPEHFYFKFNRKLREENVVEYEELDAYPEVE